MQELLSLQKIIKESGADKMANENYRRLLQDIHARRKIIRDPQGEHTNVEEFLQYLADNEYSLEWAELGKTELFTYEKRTLTSTVLNLDLEIILELPNSRIKSLKQYLCPCCEAMTEINLEISGRQYDLQIIYRGITGKELTLQQMLNFPGIDETAKLEQGA